MEECIRREEGMRTGTDQLMSTSGYETRPSLCVCASRDPNTNSVEDQDENPNQRLSPKQRVFASDIDLDLRAVYSPTHDSVRYT